MSVCPDCFRRLSLSESKYVFICEHCKKVWEWTEKEYKYGILDFLADIIKNGLYTHFVKKEE